MSCEVAPRGNEGVGDPERIEVGVLVQLARELQQLGPEDRRFYRVAEGGHVVRIAG